MARARNIKPSFFTNEVLAECSPHSRLLFIGLWTLADRRGILEDRPKRIQAAIFPYERVNIGRLLEELENGGFITRFEQDGVPGILIPTFVRHQNPHVKEGVNEVPEPDEHQTSTVLAPDKHSSSPAESLLPITESLSLENRAQPGEPETPTEVVKRQRKKAATTPPANLAETIPADVWRKIKELTQLNDEQLHFETEALIDWALAKGELRADWVATWRTWMKSPYRKSQPLMPIVKVHTEAEYEAERQARFRSAMV